MQFSWFSKLVLFLMIAGALGYFAKELWTRFKIIFKGKPLAIKNGWEERLQIFLYDVILQRQVIKGRFFAGLAHALVFWGFVFFSLGTLEHFSLGFGARPWLPEFYRAFLVFISVTTIIGAVYLAVRRFVFKPKALSHPSPISAVVLSLIGILMLTYIIGYYLTPVGFTAKFNWWVHSLSVLVFLLVIIESKHLHLVLSPFNRMFKSLVFAKLDTPDIEKMFEEAGDTEPVVGAGTLDALTWKDRFDFFTCVECGRCQDQCPAFNTNKDLNPKMLINYCKDQIKTHKEEIPDTVQAMLWQCTNCGGCEYHCPLGIEFLDKITEFRRYKVLTASEFPPEAVTMFKGLEKNANPWGMGNPAEFDAEVFDPAQHEYLFFLGCFSRYSPEYVKSAQHIIAILKKAGVSFGIMLEEGCCGDPARSLGNDLLYQVLAKMNIENFNEYKVKKIITACPHCYRRLDVDYKDLGGNYEVIHHSELLSQLVAAGKLNVKPGEYIYHDPCFLSRYRKSYTDQRTMLQNGGRLIEPEKSKLNSFCCGGGGGMMFLEEKYTKGADTSIPKISHARMKQLLENANGEPIVTACPYCFTMFNDAVKEMEIQRKIIDIGQVIES